MNAIAAYRSSQRQHASPQQIVLMLFREAVRRLAVAEDELRNGRFDAWPGHLAHVREIVLELQGALDHGAAPQMCGNLHALYGWCIRSLGEASRQRDADKVSQVCQVIETLMDGWSTAISGPTLVEVA